MNMSRNKCFLPYESPNIVLVPTSSSNNASTNCTANELPSRHVPCGENFVAPASAQGIVECTNFTSTSNYNYFSTVNDKTESINHGNTMDNFGVNSISLWTNQFGSIENTVQYPVSYLQEIHPTQSHSTFFSQGYSYTNIKPNAIMYPYATSNNNIYINQNGNTEKQVIQLCHKTDEINYKNTNFSPHTYEDISPNAHNYEDRNKEVNLKMNENKNMENNNISKVSVNLKQNMDTNLSKNDKNNLFKERKKKTKTSKHLKLLWKRHCQKIKDKIKKEIEGSKDLKTKLHAQWKSILRSEYNKFVKKFYQSALIRRKNKCVLSRETKSSKLMSVKNSNTETKNKQPVPNKIKSKIIKPKELNPGYINNGSKHTNAVKSVVKPTKTNFLRNHNYKTTLDENFDLRTKLSRKLSQKIAYPSNIRYIPRKRPRERESLVKTVNQDSKTEKQLPVITEPKPKKCKKIKLIINVVCEDSEDDLSDTISDNSGSNQDLSFLDDINIDDIVESLDCHSSTNEDKIKTKDEFDRTIKKDRNNYSALNDIDEGLNHYYTNIKPENMDILKQCEARKEIKNNQTILIQGNILNNGINEFSDNTNSLTVKNAEATVLDNLNIKSEKVHMKETCNANLSNKNVKCDMRIQPESDNRVEISLCLEKNTDELILAHETCTTFINKTNSIKHKINNENNEKNVEVIKSVLTHQLDKDIIPKKRQNCRKIKFNYENIDKNISVQENNSVQGCILNEIRYDENNTEIKSREKKENLLSVYSIDGKSYREIIHQIYDLTETNCDTILIPDNHDNINILDRTIEEKYSENLRNQKLTEEKLGTIIYEQNIRDAYGSLHTTGEDKKKLRNVETSDNNIKKLNIETPKTNAPITIKTDFKLYENKVKGSEKSTDENHTSNKALPKKQVKDPQNIPMETIKTNAERSVKIDLNFCENKVKGSEKSTGEDYTSSKALPQKRVKDPQNISMETTKTNTECPVKTYLKLSENKVKGSEKSIKKQTKDPQNIPMETTKINVEHSIKTDLKLNENKVKGNEESTAEKHISNKFKQPLPNNQVKDAQHIPIETSKTKTELSLKTDLKLGENKDKLSVKSVDGKQISNKFTLPVKGSQNIPIDKTTKNYEVLVKTDLKLGENKDKGSEKSSRENQVSNKFKETLPDKQVKDSIETSKLNAEILVKTDLKLGENINKGSEKSTNEHHISNKLQHMKDINKQVKNLSALEKDFVKNLERQMFGIMNDRYILITLIRNGKFSKIYKCSNSKNENYAVKMLKNVSDRLIRGVFKEKMLTKLQKYNDNNHLNIVHLLNCYDITGYWCFIMEYYPKNLEEALQENKKCFHINLVQALAKQLVEAVIVLTNWKIIHTDIKPKHILINNTNDKLKLCGFDDSNYIKYLEIMPNTGTASYRAPEVILGFTADYRIDVWSTALVIFEMATGKKLFPGIYNNDILYKQICTLGLISYDMLEASIYKDLHFLKTSFMRKVGNKGRNIELIQSFNKNTRLNKMLFQSYTRDWESYATQQEVFEDKNKLNNLYQLLEHMLNMDPRYRLPINFVPASEFIQTNFLFY